MNWFNGNRVGNLWLLRLQSWLESSKHIPREHDEPKIALRNVFGDKYLIVSIRVRTRQGGTRDFTYTFPLQRLDFQGYAQQHRMSLRSGWQSVYQDNGADSGEDEELQVCIGNFENRSHARAVGRLHAQSSLS